MPCRATQDGWVMVESSHWKREWQTTSVFLSWESHKQYEKAKNRTLKEELLRLVDAQYATEEEWRNNSRKNEEMEPKQKQNPVVDVTGGRSKIQCCKEQYCIGTWNVRSMNQGKLEVVKQVKGCCWTMKRGWDSWPLEKNSIWGQRRGLIAQNFCVIKFY